MKKVQIKIILIVLTGLFFYTDSIAQETTRAEQAVRAKKAIVELEGGTLVLRLSSKQNKINKLEELLANSEIKESTRTRLRKQLETTIDERNTYNLSLAQAFKEYYSFSDIYFMYDTASVSLKAGKKSGLFLDENLEFDPNIKIPDGPFFVIRVGTTDASSTTGVEALVIMDEHLKDMMRPFPYYARVNRIGRLFARIFNYKQLIKKDSKEIVQKVDRNLRRYALQAGF